MSKKNREKRRLRQEMGKQDAPQRALEASAFLRSFENHIKTPEPAAWPGACEPSLGRPDMVKLEIAQWAMGKEPGRTKCRQLERNLANGPLCDHKDLKHWGMEEFIWHGLPGDFWHPIEAFLANAKDRFSPAGCAQIRRWKEARIGFFEIGPVANDLVVLREWDPIEGMVCGPDFRSIALNIGGVNFYRQHMDAIQLIYVAPWVPEEGICCAMGYGKLLLPLHIPYYLPLLGLRTPEVVARPLPWKASPAALHEHQKIWRQRYWNEWLRERLQFPFQGIIAPGNNPQVRWVKSLLPSTPQESHDIGNYLGIDLDGEPGAFGVTNVLPMDPTSPNALPLAEYRDYREAVGYPPAVRGLPDYFQIQQ